ncbi:MAG: FtsQ-type POTRA domain-containing protein [Candidatus Omnitrophica bacterium]|nr:FtsQ-type POTRA domain-containing protein [Candidatus Omnitrophota bacterium]
MAKKPSVNIPAIHVVRLIVFLFIGLVLFACYARAVEFLTTSQLFAVRDVMIDASIQFVDTGDLRRLKGRNIFKVDIQKLQDKIKAQYPQIAQLQVVRQLPDRIKVLAQKRDALVQAIVKGKVLLIDTEGVAMYYAASAVDLPVVQCELGAPSKIILGAPLASKSIHLAVQMVRRFKAAAHLSRLKITSLDLFNLSRIDLTVGQGLHVILDQDNYASKLEMLELMAAQKKIDFTQFKYVDLRFNEPILGEHPKLESK